MHPAGNPHFSLDPGLAPIITQNIVDGLARVAPESRAAFEQNRKAFLAQLDARMAQWTKIMEPVRGSKVVVFHPDYHLLPDPLRPHAGRRGRGPAGDSALAAAPGEPVRQMKEEKIKVILVEPWNDVKLANRIAEEAGAKAFVMASAVGAVKGADNYIAAIDYNITTLAKALQ